MLQRRGCPTAQGEGPKGWTCGEIQRKNVIESHFDNTKGELKNDEAGICSYIAIWLNSREEEVPEEI